ncbi:MAG TPA: sigma-54 dependent transcriptional regulator, partial [Longimicrobiales bacterium]|nr:sigma-54 dependent transcriptional regulator [Longimicrobiales bacterium]
MANEKDPIITVLVADDDIDQRVLIERLLKGAEGARHMVTPVPDGRSALTALREQVFDVALLDVSMPGLDGLDVLEAIAGDPARPQVVFVTGHGTVAAATRAMKLGAYDFVEKPVDRDRLLTLVWKAAAARRVQAKTERLEAVVSRDAGEVRIITQDRRVREALALLAKVAPSDVSVLVTGESGTGKELVARELHRLSGRQQEPLVALNCAAVSEALAESELFGHEKGSFTGAAQRKIGLIELSDGGTLFLDEIGDLAQPLQAKLLRALEARIFRRVGGVREIPTNFRLVSATNQPLIDLVEEGSFRGDLFYRINAVVVDLPPLRERKGDISLLARHFLDEARPGHADGHTLSPEATAILERYPWPGNVRELRNVMERAALLAPGDVVRPEDLGASLQGAGPSGAAASPAAPGHEELPALNLDELERRAIEEALVRTAWHQGQAAELLGISDRTLHRKIRTLGLRRPD